MEKVFSIEIGASSLLNQNLVGGFSSSQRARNGVVEKILGPERFIVVLEDGSKLRVSGAVSLRVGDKVQVRPPTSVKETGLSSSDLSESVSAEGGFEWSAFIPLGFGGKGASAKLEVFVEKKAKRSLEKKIPTAYFVFTVQTERLGEIQWSIYLRGRQVTLQVYAPMVGSQKESLKDIVKKVEGALKNKGLVLMGPVAFLNHPFRVPTGFRLNVRG